MASSGQNPLTDLASWDTKPTTTDYQPPLPATPTPTVIPKTVDYGHGHGMRNKEEYFLNIISQRYDRLSFSTVLLK